MRNDLSPHTQGAYVNYHDATLSNPLEAYYGPNLARLVDIKARWDPTNLFNYPHSLPTKLDF